MTAWRRFARFNVVGLAGFVLQLTSVALLVSWLGVDYLISSVLALAITLAHNFAWHVWWTWADRADAHRSLPRAFVRFVTANGLVSLAGAVALVPLFVEIGGMAPVAANVASIVVCGLVNFWLAGSWCFASTGSSRTGARRRNRLRATA